MLRSILIVVCSLLLPLSYSTLTHAESVMTLDKALKLVLNRSPLVKEVESSFLIRAAESQDVRRLNNPKLELSYGSVTTNNTDGEEIEFSLEQPIRLSDLSARTRLSRVMQEVNNFEQQKQLLDLFVEVKHAYARTWILNQRKRVLQKSLSQIASLTKMFSSGSQLGAYGKGELSLVRAEIAKLKAELLGIDAAILVSSSELTRLVGASIDHASLKAPEIDVLTNLETIQDKLSSGSSKLQQRIRLLSKVAERESSVASSDSFPELRPKLFYSKTDDGLDIFGVGVSFDLPVFDQNSTQRSKSNASLNLAKSNQQYFASPEFVESVMNIARAFNLKKAQLEIYENDVLPSLQKSFTIFEKQTSSGGGDAFKLWQVLNEYIDTHEEYSKMWTETLSERSRLEVLLEEEI